MNSDIIQELQRLLTGTAPHDAVILFMNALRNIGSSSSLTSLVEFVKREPDWRSKIIANFMAKRNALKAHDRNDWQHIVAEEEREFIH